MNSRNQQEEKSVSELTLEPTTKYTQTHTGTHKQKYRDLEALVGDDGANRDVGPDAPRKLRVKEGNAVLGRHRGQIVARARQLRLAPSQRVEPVEVQRRKQVRRKSRRQRVTGGRLFIDRGIKGIS